MDEENDPQTWESSYGGVCPVCHGRFRFQPEDTALDFFPTELTSSLNTLCPHCQATLRIPIGTGLARWLFWAGIDTRVQGPPIHPREAGSYLRTLHDDEAFQAELRELFEPEE